MMNVDDAIFCFVNQDLLNSILNSMTIKIPNQIFYGSRYVKSLLVSPRQNPLQLKL